MAGDLVELAIINRALMLHQSTPLMTTLRRIRELTDFRNNHESCGNIIFTLKDEMTKLKATILQQSQKYFRQQLEIAKFQSSKLFVLDKTVSTPTFRPKEYPRFQSLQQFIEQELEIKMKKNKQKNMAMRIVQSFNQYYFPIKEILKREMQKSGDSLEKGEEWEGMMSDYV